MTSERNMRYRRWHRWIRREIAAGRDFRHGFILSGNLTAGSEFYRLPAHVEEQLHHRLSDAHWAENEDLRRSLELMQGGAKIPAREEDR